MCSGQSPPGATSSVQRPGSLAVSELYQGKTDGGETLVGEVCPDSGIRLVQLSLHTCPAHS